MAWLGVYEATGPPAWTARSRSRSCTRPEDDESAAFRGGLLGRAAVAPNVVAVTTRQMITVTVFLAMEPRRHHLRDVIRKEAPMPRAVVALDRAGVSALAASTAAADPPATSSPENVPIDDGRQGRRLRPGLALSARTPSTPRPAAS